MDIKDCDRSPLNNLELVKIIEDLKHDLPRSLYMVAAIRNSMENNAAHSSFYTDSWPSYSVVIRYQGKGSLLHWLLMYFKPGREEKAVEVLKKNSVFDWSLRSLIGSPSTLCIFHRELADFHGGVFDIDAEADCAIYYATDESSLQNVAIPDGLNEGVLSAEDSYQVNNEWKYGGEERHRKYIHSLIENFQTVALFTAEGRCVAYMLTYDYGAIGMLYVVPDQRGRGCAKYIITTLAKKHLKDGHCPYLFIEEDNEASILLHVKCGFRMVENFKFRFLPFVKSQHQS